MARDVRGDPTLYSAISGVFGAVIEVEGRSQVRIVPAPCQIMRVASKSVTHPQI